MLRATQTWRLKSSVHVDEEQDKTRRRKQTAGFTIGLNYSQRKFWLGLRLAGHSPMVYGWYNHNSLKHLAVISQAKKDLVLHTSNDLAVVYTS